MREEAHVTLPMRKPPCTRWQPVLHPLSLSCDLLHEQHGGDDERTQDACQQADGEGEWRLGVRTSGYTVVGLDSSAAERGLREGGVVLELNKRARGYGKKWPDEKRTKATKESKSSSRNG